MLPGEGKSIIIGIISNILALLGYDIYIVCHNIDFIKKYLKNFTYLFTYF